MVDPIQSLPSEVIASVFSSLTTPSLALASGVSTDWRGQVQAAKSLHRSLDLSSKALSEIETINLINRLASQHPLPFKEMHLNLKCYWEKWAEIVEGDVEAQNFTFGEMMEFSSFRFIALLTTIFSATQGKLERLFIVIPTDDPEREDFESSNDSFSLLRILAGHGVAYLQGLVHGIEEFHFTVPGPLSFSSGRAGSKKFTIVGNEWGFLNDVQIYTALIRQATIFTGSGLERCDFNSEHFLDRFPEVDWDEEEDPQAGRLEDVKEFFEELNNSKSTLKTLKLTSMGSDLALSALNLVTSCPNLSDLELEIQQEIDNDFLAPNQSYLQIKFPQDVSSSSLKRLKLEASRVDFSWDSEQLVEWVGNQIEDLEITWRGSDQSKLPATFVYRVLASNSSLKKLSLRDMIISKPNSSNPPLSLPHLETLELERVTLVGENLFKEDHLPSVKYLLVSSPVFTGSGSKKIEEEEGGDGSAPFKHLLLPLLKSCNSSMQRLEIGNRRRKDTRSENVIQESISFPELTEIAVTHASAFLINTVQQHHLPNIKKLEIRFFSFSFQAIINFLPSLGNSLEVLSLGLQSTSVSSGKRKDLVSPAVLASSSSIKKPSFPKLKSLSLNGEGLLIGLYFSNASFGSLEELNAMFIDGEWSGKEDQISKQEVSKVKLLKDVLSISKNNVFSIQRMLLQSFNVKGKGDDSMSSFDETSISFPKLNFLTLYECSPLLVKFFKNCNRPNLSSFQSRKDWSARDFFNQPFDEVEEV